MDLKNKIFLFGGFYPENTEKTIKDLMSKFENGERDLELFINSDGGYITDLFAVVDTIDKYRKEGLKLSTVAVGAAQSAGALLLMYGDKRYAGKNTSIMVHGAQGGLFGSAEDVRKYLARMDKINETFADIISAKTGITKEEANLLLKEDRTFTADEAVKYGIIDGIWDVDGTVSELSKYISENLAASSKPTAEVTEAIKFVASVRSENKQKREVQMPENDKLELELQAKKTVVNDLTAQVTSLNAEVVRLTAELKKSESYKAEFYDNQKKQLIASAKKTVSEDPKKQEEFEAKLNKFMKLDYDEFKDLTETLLNANKNTVPTGVVIDSTKVDELRAQEKKIKDANPQATAEEIKAMEIINEGLKASAEKTDLSYAKSCVGIKEGGK